MLGHLPVSPYWLPATVTLSSICILANVRVPLQMRPATLSPGLPDRPLPSASFQSSRQVVQQHRDTLPVSGKDIALLYTALAHFILSITGLHNRPQAPQALSVRLRLSIF